MPEQISLLKSLHLLQPTQSEHCDAVSVSGVLINEGRRTDGKEIPGRAKKNKKQKRRQIKKTRVLEDDADKLTYFLKASVLIATADWKERDSVSGN